MSLASLPNLRTIVMHTNQVASLDLLCDPAFHALESVNLASNRITEVPEGLATNIPGLLELNVENNSISNLPNNIGFHPKLRSLRIEGNAFRSIRRTVVEQGTGAVMTFLRNRASEAEYMAA
jgi:Leucine-rich repeat (LRR) protein